MTFISLHTYIWAFLVAQMVKYPPASQETWVQSLGWEDPMEKGMATESRILGVENPHGQRSLVLSRAPCTIQCILAGYLSYALEKEMATHSSVLPGESQGWWNLVGCCLWGRAESDMTEVT